MQSIVQRIQFSFTQPKPAKLKHEEMAKNKEENQGLPKVSHTEIAITVHSDLVSRQKEPLKKTMTNIPAIDYSLQISLAFSTEAFTFTNVNHLHSSLISPQLPH